MSDFRTASGTDTFSTRPSALPARTTIATATALAATATVSSAATLRIHKRH
jgi:hypothetical protein